MKHIKSLLCFLLLSGFGTTILAQITIPASGGNTSGTGGTVSYTLGQIVNSTLAGTNGTITQGVQQPYEISVVTAIESAKDITLECTVYPNPAREVVKLVFEALSDEEMRFHLYDINGVLLQDKKVVSKETEIYLGNLAPSLYFLKVIKNNLEIKVFKIVKN